MIGGRLERWLGLDRLAYPVPAHATQLPAILGGITFVGLALLFVTGIGLAQFVVPLPDQAYASVKAMAAHPVAAYLRALHYWLAQAVVLTLLAHLARVFLVAAYKPPRTATWLVGVGLFLAVVLGAYFTGTVLKWDQEGVEALQHYGVAVRQLGLSAVLGPEATPAPLFLRVYVFHLAVFPLTLIALAATHFYLVNTFNLAPLPRRQADPAPHVPPEEMTETLWGVGRKILRASAIYYGAVALVSLIVPAPLGPAATGSPTGAKPPWPFLWLYGLESLFGLSFLVTALILMTVFLLIIPSLDRGAARHPKDRTATIVTAGLVVAGLLVLSLYGWWIPQEVHTGDHHASSRP